MHTLSSSACFISSASRPVKKSMAGMTLPQSSRTPTVDPQSSVPSQDSFPTQGSFSSLPIVLPFCCTEMPFVSPCSCSFFPLDISLWLGSRTLFPAWSSLWFWPDLLDESGVVALFFFLLFLLDLLPGPPALPTAFETSSSSKLVRSSCLAISAFHSLHRSCSHAYVRPARMPMTLRFPPPAPCQHLEQALFGPIGSCHIHRHSDSGSLSAECECECEQATRLCMIRTCRHIKRTPVVRLTTSSISISLIRHFTPCAK
mmetsp:Transcript_20264/g.56326  ORF Transcript_20264/g.56326 Transcript_20264/m.56326 type:complete len:258 (+) Transcript_20264:76-849(+)